MNEGNVRDHLANERTFLAWVRTGVALMGFGIVIAKLRFLTVAPAAGPPAPPPGTRSTLLGLGFAGVGLLTLLFAIIHYERTRRAIGAGDYRASGWVLVVFVALLFALGLASILYLLTLAPGATGLVSFRLPGNMGALPFVQ